MKRVLVIARSRRSVFALALCASCAAAKAPVPTRPEPPHGYDPPPCAPASSLTLWGNLGRTLAVARIAVTDAGYRGDLHLLGSDDFFAVSGTRGPRIPISDDPYRGAPVYECRFEVGSLFGTLTGRCTESVPATEPSLSIDGSWSIPSAQQGVPAFLSAPTYSSVPDDVYAALAREEAGEHDCAAFVDVREARRLSRSRAAVLYERRYPCEPSGGNPGTGRYRFALVEDDLPRRFTFSGPLEGIDDYNGEPTLAVHETGERGRSVFDLVFTDGADSGNGNSYVESRQALFGLTAKGRAGPLLELPTTTIECSGCKGPLDTTSPWFVELDGTPPAEVVLEHEHIEVPCSDGPTPPSEDGDERTFVAYRFDAEQARFDPIPLASGALAVQQRRGWNTDISRPADDWRRATDELCVDGTDGL